MGSASFEEFWTIATAAGTTMRAAIERTTPTDAEQLKSRVRTCLPADAAGHITYQAVASAI